MQNNTTSIENKEASELREPIPLRYIILVLASVLIITPILLPMMYKCWWSGTLKTNELGDALGGMLGPIMAAIGAALVYLAFLEQRLANKIQMQAILREQDFDILLKLHDKILERSKAMIITEAIARSERRSIIANGTREVIDYYLTRYYSLIIEDQANNLDNILTQEFFIQINSSWRLTDRTTNALQKILSKIEEKYKVQKLIKDIFNERKQGNYLNETLRLLALIDSWCSRLDKSTMSQEDKIALASGYMKPLFDDNFSITILGGWEKGHFPKDDREFSVIWNKEKKIAEILKKYAIPMELE